MLQCKRNKPHALSTRNNSYQQNIIIIIMKTFYKVNFKSYLSGLNSPSEYPFNLVLMLEGLGDGVLETYFL